MGLLSFFRSKDPQKEMGFVDHLEELRWVILRSLAVILVGAVVAFIYRDEIFDTIILGPLRKDFISYRWMCQLGEWLGAKEYLCPQEGVVMKLQSTEVTGVFNMSIQLAFIGGLLFAFPYAIWEVWRFIRPALKEAEAKRTTEFVFYISVLFFIGVVFGYLVVAPFSINFLFSFNLGTMSTIEIKPTISDYMENLTMTVLGVAIGFELPIVIYLLSKMGIVHAKQLKKFRKYAFVIILFIAAVITPSPDWISQMIVAVPLLILFELSVFVAERIDKRRKLKEVWQ